MKPEDKKVLLGSSISDILDVLPPLPGLDTIGSIIDAANIQYVRSKYPEAKTATGIQLLETVDFPIPFVPSPLELLPSNVGGSLSAIRQQRLEARKAKNRQLIEQSPWRR